jgi:hypothetical protein
MILSGYLIVTRQVSREFFFFLIFKILNDLGHFKKWNANSRMHFIIPECLSFLRSVM